MFYELRSAGPRGASSFPPRGLFPMLRDFVITFVMWFIGLLPAAAFVAYAVHRMVEWKRRPGITYVAPGNLRQKQNESTV